MGNLSYTYDASGNKLVKNSNGTVRDYVDGIGYKPDGTTIDIIHTEEGIARNSGGIYSYEYNLGDHLGNVRATFYKNPNTNLLEVLQRDDYYAFGLRKVASDGTNKYLYNGKELQEELGQYDYGARFYDPVIGRWNVVDPSSEQGGQESLTQYQYGMNNPIRYTDPDGRCPTCPFIFDYLYQSAKYKIQSVFGLKTYADGMMEKANNQVQSQDPDYVQHVPEKTRAVNDRGKDIQANTKIIQGGAEMMGNASDSMGMLFGAVQGTFSLGTPKGPSNVVSLDNNALVAAIENGEKKAVMTVIGDAKPTVSITAAKEFLVKGDKRALGGFMKQIGARIGSNGSGTDVQTIATGLGRKVGVNDGNIIGGAMKSGATILTRDTKMI